MNVIEQIHSEAFKEGSFEYMPEDLQGWMDMQSFPRFFEESVCKRAGGEPLLIIEVGSWKGLSACLMASILKTSNIRGKIIAIDTWLGSPEHMGSTQIGERRLGVPRLYEQFISNVYHKKLQDIIYPFPISSVQGGYYLEQANIKADIIYIDAGHEYEAVKLDLEVFWRILKEGGHMLMDDYNWEGVRRAMEEFSSKEGIKYIVSGNVIKIEKPYKIDKDSMKKIL